MKNYILIAGAMKSGTTTLFDHLASHPAVVGVHPKEPGFFAFPHLFARGMKWYDSLYEFEPGQHEYRLDGSTDYSKFPFVDGVPLRLAALEDGAQGASLSGNFGGSDTKEKAEASRFKLIYVMRHPLRRIESHARHTELQKKEVGQFVSDRLSHSLEFGVSDVSLATSRYADQIDQYRRWYERGDMYLLTLEDFEENPQRCLTDIYRFLNIADITLAEENKVSNKGGFKYQAHPVAEWMRHTPMLRKMAQTLLSEEVRRRLRQKAKKKVVAEGRFKLTAGEEAEILSYLAPDLCRLRDVYHIDVQKQWGIDCDLLLGAGAARRTEQPDEQEDTARVSTDCPPESATSESVKLDSIEVKSARAASAEIEATGEAPLANKVVQPNVI